MRETSATRLVAGIVDVVRGSGPQVRRVGGRSSAWFALLQEFVQIAETVEVEVFPAHNPCHVQPEENYRAGFTEAQALELGLDVGDRAAEVLGFRGWRLGHRFQVSERRNKQGLGCHWLARPIQFQERGGLWALSSGNRDAIASRPVPLRGLVPGQS